MLAILQSWAQAGWIRWLDAEFANFLHQEAQAVHTEASPLLLLGAALCSHQNGHGHLCLDLGHCLQAPERALLLPPEHALHTPELTPTDLLSRIDINEWKQALLNNPLLCQRTQESACGDPASEGLPASPLLLQPVGNSGRLYLRRFWVYESSLLHTIMHKLQQPVDVDETALRESLDAIFHNISKQPSHNKADLQPDWQKIACALCVRSRFAIVTGGPGTGKTTTVVKLLSVLQSMHRLQGADALLRIRLAAPTGKAAARLSASIARQLAELPNREGIPSDVTTVHRLLGPLRHSRYFRHDAARPLPADVVVIDEASMVDVELMAQLMDALPAHCRLILLGDKDQLASVEAGAVLGSLCSHADEGRYYPHTAQWVQRVTGQSVPSDLVEDLLQPGTALDQAITMLRYSHRFGTIPGIGELASAVNGGAGLDALLDLFKGRFKELQWLALRSSRQPAFDALVSDRATGYGAYLALLAGHPAPASLTDPASGSTEESSPWDRWADQVLTAHTGFQLLCALRKGEFGVEQINIRVRDILLNQGLITLPERLDQAEWYAGRPVMVTRNDYNLELMNGDIGICLPFPARSGELVLRVAFRDTANPDRIRWILPTRLQDVETVFAMTVHKSQGSEFAHTALLLPAHDSPILTRELVYTGVTRASRQFTLLCPEASVLHQAVATRVFRAGGLEDRLRQTPASP